MLRAFARSCSLENNAKGSQYDAAADVISPHTEEEEQLLTEEDSNHRSLED